MKIIVRKWFIQQIDYKKNIWAKFYKNLFYFIQDNQYQTKNGKNM